MCCDVNATKCEMNRTKFQRCLLQIPITFTSPLKCQQFHEIIIRRVEKNTKSKPVTTARRIPVPLFIRNENLSLSAPCPHLVALVLHLQTNNSFGNKRFQFRLNHHVFTQDANWSPNLNAHSWVRHCHYAYCFTATTKTRWEHSTERLSTRT